MEVAVCRHRMHLIRYGSRIFKAYTVVNAQITKYFRQWSIYVGAENLFNYKQPNPIIDASNPRGDKLRWIYGVGTGAWTENLCGYPL